MAVATTAPPAPARLDALPAPGAADHERIASIDVVRGLTILVMIFVNDLAGVSGAPAWMKHVDPPGADGMTFVDVVFPAFLFIVGLSIPFALGRRLERAEPRGRLWRHLLGRTLGLLLIGVFMVNTEVMSPEGVLPPALWTLLMYAAVALVWGTPPSGWLEGRRARGLVRAGGALLLGVLAVLYRGPGPEGFVEMRPYWWGILGLIGWAYLVACAAYLLLRDQPVGLLGTTALLYCLYVADAAGAFAGLTAVTRWVSIGSMLGSHAAITVSGVLLGTMLRPGAPARTAAARIRSALLFGLGLAAAGALLHTARDVHPMFIVNKIAATPPWCLWSSAFTVWIWTGIYWLLDVRGWSRGTGLLRLAGQNALLAYILAPVLYAMLALLPPAAGSYAALGDGFATGLWRAVLFAFAVTWLAAALRRRQLVLKL